MSLLPRASRESGRPTVTLPGGSLHSGHRARPSAARPGVADPGAEARVACPGADARAASSGAEASAITTPRTAREDLR